MKDLSIASDIVPVGQFKAGLAKYLKDIRENKNSLVITQNGRAAGVLISPSEYDELRETKLFIESISKGLSDSEQGNVFTTSKMRDELKKLRMKH